MRSGSFGHTTTEPVGVSEFEEGRPLDRIGALDDALRSLAEGFVGEFVDLPYPRKGWRGASTGRRVATSDSATSASTCPPAASAAPETQGTIPRRRLRNHCSNAAKHDHLTAGRLTAAYDFQSTFSERA